MSQRKKLLMSTNYLENKIKNIPYLQESSGR